MSRLAAFLLLLAAAAAPADDRPTVAGVVVDSTGEPVAGAAVGRYTADGPQFSESTGADGAFAVPKLRYLDGTFGVPSLIARGPDGSLGRPVGGGGRDGEPVRLVLRPAETTAVTVAAADGAPAAGVSVLGLANLKPVAVAVTDDRGEASLTFPAGTPLRQVVAWKGGVGFGHYQNQSVVNSRITLKPVPTTVRLSLSQARPHTVRAVAVGGADGTAPAEGVTVRVWTVDLGDGQLDANLSGCGFAAAATGADGRAVLDWLPGGADRVGLIVSSGGRFGRVQASLEGPDPPAETVTELVANGTIAGRVSVPGGGPAAGVDVRARGAAVAYNGAQSSHLAVTGGDGRYEMTVPGAAAYLVVPLPGHLGSWRERDPDSRLAAAVAGADEPIVVGPGERRDDLDFALEPGVALTGVLTRDARAVPGETVYLTVTAPAAPQAVANAGAFAEPILPEMARSTTTDDAGFYTFRRRPRDVPALRRRLRRSRRDRRDHPRRKGRGRTELPARPLTAPPPGRSGHRPAG